METVSFKQNQVAQAIVPTHDQAALKDFVTLYKSSISRMSALQNLLHHNPFLLSGDHYWRSISYNGEDFYFPGAQNYPYPKVFAWSRILEDKEILCAINLDQNESAYFYITIDKNMHPAEGKIYCIHGTDDCPTEINIETRNGKSVRLFIPAGALVSYKA